MPTCDDYQLAFEMQLHGAAPTISSEEIAAHIAGCATCAGYVTASQETETMRTTNWIQHDHFDSSKLLERVKAELSPTLRQRLPNLAFAALMLGFTIAVLVVSGLDRSLVIGGVCGCGAALYVVLKQGRERRIAWARLADRPTAEMIATRRSELKTRHKYARIVQWFPVGYVVLKLIGMTDDGLGLRFWLQLSALVVLALVVVIQDRRDARELRELGD